VDDELIPYLKCDIELNVSAPVETMINKRTADILRQLADRIENDDYEEGHHPVKDKFGKEVGTVYFDCYGEITQCPTGPKGQKRPGDVIGAAIKVARIATGEEGVYESRGYSERRRFRSQIE
jgi:hypothetical protein